MHLVTTTRFHLVAALVAACTLTQQGFAIAALLLGLEALRVLARHYLNKITTGPTALGLASVPAYSTTGIEQAAVTRQPLAS
jgi:hypothetical protein